MSIKQSIVLKCNDSEQPLISIPKNVDFNTELQAELVQATSEIIDGRLYSMKSIQCRRSEDVQKKWDSGCDPIDFFSTRLLYDKGDKDKKMPSKVKTTDWAKSRLLKLILEIQELPDEDKMKEIR